MKQLRFTTSRPGFFGSVEEPLIQPEEVGVVEMTTEPVHSIAYIHNDAETLAGYDIPIFIDGDLSQLDNSLDNQDILMMLPSGNYPCKSVPTKDLTQIAYYLTLK